MFSYNYGFSVIVLLIINKLLINTNIQYLGARPTSTVKSVFGPKLTRMIAPHDALQTTNDLAIIMGHRVEPINHPIHNLAKL